MVSSLSSPQAPEKWHNVPVPDSINKFEIIRALVGSTLYGTGEPGQEDTDYMGVCIEPWESVLGLDHFEHWIWRTQPEGHRSGPGDVDITIYGLNKWMRLAVKGNPSILVLLFAPLDLCPITTYWGHLLQELAPDIISRRVAQPFMGYCKAQRERLEDVRGGRHTNRPELIDKYGYDTKYAMHALRLAYQGQEILRTGYLELPMADKPREFLLAVRTGQVPYEDFMAVLNNEEECLLAAAEKSTLPEEPNYNKINQFLKNARLNVWGLCE